MAASSAALVSRATEHIRHPAVLPYNGQAVNGLHALRQGVAGYVCCTYQQRVSSPLMAATPRTQGVRILPEASLGCLQLQAEVRSNASTQQCSAPSNVIQNTRLCVEVENTRRVQKFHQLHHQPPQAPAASISLRSLPPQPCATRPAQAAVIRSAALSATLHTSPAHCSSPSSAGGHKEWPHCIRLAEAAGNQRLKAGQQQRTPPAVLVRAPQQAKAAHAVCTASLAGSATSTSTRSSGGASSVSTSAASFAQFPTSPGSSSLEVPEEVTPVPKLVLPDVAQDEDLRSRSSPATLSTSATSQGSTSAQSTTTVAGDGNEAPARAEDVRQRRRRPRRATWANVGEPRPGASAAPEGHFTPPLLRRDKSITLEAQLARCTRELRELQEIQKLQALPADLQSPSAPSYQPGEQRPAAGADVQQLASQLSGRLQELAADALQCGCDRNVPGAMDVFVHATDTIECMANLIQGRAPEPEPKPTAASGAREASTGRTPASGSSGACGGCLSALAGAKATWWRHRGHSGG